MNEECIKYNQTRESLEFALESGKMGTWDFDLKTDHILCSKVMLDLWGIEPHDFNNNRSILKSKVHPEDLERMNFEINEAIKNRTIYELEYRIIPRSGQLRWVLSRGRCTFHPDSSEPSRLAGVVYDITEKKNREIELALALEARSEFFSVAGHELKTPLTCLHLQNKVLEYQIQDLVTYGSTAATIKKSLEKQQQHLNRITRLVDNILDESKIAKGLFSLSLEWCCLNEIAEEVLEQARLMSQKSDVSIKFSRSESVRGKWDRYRLEQVLLNLLMNGIRYGNSSPVQLEIIPGDSRVLIIVSDKGYGIGADDQGRIFKRFERGNQDTSTSGMGLGLYISNSIITAHGGEIRLKSELGKGSEFIVDIPYDATQA